MIHATGRADLLVSADELARLTGYLSARGQRKWLDAHGWRYEVARDGSPRVAYAYFLLRLGVHAETANHATEPNWTAIG